MQPAFLIELLKALGRENIHTVIETSGYASWTVVDEVSKYTDLFLYDLKILDPELSVKYTGVSSGAIIDNLRKLKYNGCNIQVRIPLIPSVNDSEKSLDEAAACLAELGIEEVELIPYHDYGTAKYANLGLENCQDEFKVHSMEQLAEIKSMLESRGININCEAG